MTPSIDEFFANTPSLLAQYGWVVLAVGLAPIVVAGGVVVAVVRWMRSRRMT